MHGRLPRWMRAAADTSDLVQDALLRTIGRGDKFQLRDRRALASYLHRAVENRIRDEFRRGARRASYAVPEEDLTHPAPSPLELTIANETWARYRAALADLPSRDRELIVGHLELDYSPEQLGCMIGRSPNAARMALHRAVRRLAAQMGEP